MFDFSFKRCAIKKQIKFYIHHVQVIKGDSEINKVVGATLNVDFQGRLTIMMSKKKDSDGVTTEKPRKAKGE